MKVLPLILSGEMSRQGTRPPLILETGEIATRHFCQPLGWYGREWSFPERNTLYVEHALELSRKADRRCLDRAGVQPEDVGALFFVSTRSAERSVGKEGRSRWSAYH